MITRLSLCTLLVCTITKLYSQNTEDYIISSSNDTIMCKLDLPKAIFGGINFNKLYKEIRVSDSMGTEKIFKPTDIKGFRFTLGSKDYSFFSKPVEKGNYLFLEAVITGKETKLYRYTVLRNYNNMSSTQEYYTLENCGGDYLYLSNFDKLSSLREKLKNFYIHKPGIQELIDGKFQLRRDIQNDIASIIERVNIEM